MGWPAVGPLRVCFSGGGRYRAVAAAGDCDALLQPIQGMRNLIEYLR